MLTALGDISIEQFLAEYWQKKPLLIRQAFKNFQSPIDANLLAGMALAEEVESRLIIEQRQPQGPSQWDLKCGPFSEQDFQELPKSHWTLLVQAVDHFMPDMAALLDQFRFIPNWRLDDLMVSYAPFGGSVGPHFDYYDVFLLQAQGQRRWQVGQSCTEDAERLEGTELSILKTFDETQDWTLEAGDMLYLPPQLAHWGVSQSDDCMTFSVGFRAPSHADIISEFSQHLASKLPAHQRYSDPQLTAQANSGEISTQAIEQVQQLLREALGKPSDIAHWLGSYMTEAKYDSDLGRQNFTEQEWLNLLDCDHVIEQDLSARLAWHASAQQKSEGLCTLFALGDTLECTQDFAEYLCTHRLLDTQWLIELNGQNKRQITELLNSNVLVVVDTLEEDDDDSF